MKSAGFSFIELSVWLALTTFVLGLIFYATLFLLNTARTMQANIRQTIAWHTAIQLMHEDFSHAPTELSAYTARDAHTIAYRTNAAQTIAWQSIASQLVAQQRVAAQYRLIRSFTYKTADGTMHTETSTILEALTQCTFTPTVTTGPVRAGRVRDVHVRLERAGRTLDATIIVHAQQVAERRDEQP